MASRYVRSCCAIGWTLVVMRAFSSLDVQQFAVWQQDAQSETDFLGYCYLDLFPRSMLPLPPVLPMVADKFPASKYPHAAVWPLLPGYDLPSGKRHFPITAMVANLAKPTGDKPALMRHSDVVTFFHEMGHVFHGLLSHTRFKRFHGTKCVYVIPVIDLI
jgi:Zn-dependent oligopeptidase